MSDKYVTVEDFENYKKHVETIMKKKESSSKETKEVKPRQPNAYALFLKDTLPKVRTQHPELTKNDHFKKVAELWKEKNKDKDNKDHKEQSSK